MRGRKWPDVFEHKYKESGENNFIITFVCFCNFRIQGKSSCGETYHSSKISQSTKLSELRILAYLYFNIYFFLTQLKTIDTENNGKHYYKYLEIWNSYSLIELGSFNIYGFRICCVVKSIQSELNFTVLLPRLFFVGWGERYKGIIVNRKESKVLLSE